MKNPKLESKPDNKSDNKRHTPDNSEVVSTTPATEGKGKRQLKATPVTVREQGKKARGKSSRTSVWSLTGRYIAAPFKVIGRVFRPLGRFKPIRIIGYILAPPYIRNAFKELRLVTWPTGKQSRQLTFAVIIFSLIFGLIAAVIDHGLDKIFRSLILHK